MSRDFATTLELQLNEAERLLERGGRFARWVAALRARRLSPAVAIGLAAVVAVVLGAVALMRGHDENRVVNQGPAVVARKWLSPEPTIACTDACAITDPYMELAPGFGALWIGGVEHGEVVRLDPGSRRVTARIPVGKLPSGIVATGDAVWVVVSPSDTSSTLVRIDPARNRVTARIPVPRLSIVPPPMLTGADGTLWLLGAERGIRIDPSRRAVAQHIDWNFGGGVYAKAFGLAGDDLWARAEDGRLLRFDARSGERKGGAEGPPGIGNLAVIPDAGVVVATEDGSLTRIDASSGRRLWTRRIADVQVGESGSGRTARTVAIAGGTVWALTRPGSRGTERLTAVDLGTGKVLGSTALKDPGAGWLKVVDDDLWYIAPEGYAVAMRP